MSTLYPRLAARQLVTNVFDMPYPAGTWLSVLRRAGVVTVCFGIALLSGNLEFGIAAAFGALQMGLAEAAVGRSRLALLLLLNMIVLPAVVIPITLLSGTWWTVPLLAALGFAQGVSSSYRFLAPATMISVLSVAVVFSGQPRSLSGSLATAAVLAAGVAAQALTWLVTWRLDRELFIRRALSNSLRSTRDLIMHEGNFGRAMTQASSRPDAIANLLNNASLSHDLHALFGAISDAIDNTRRSVISWLVLKKPDLQERQEIFAYLTTRMERIGDVSRAHSQPEVPTFLESPESWSHERAFAADLRALDNAIDMYFQQRSSISNQSPEQPHDSRTWNVRHGIRMAIGLGVAQSVALIGDFPHAFWIPLAVVFVLKPDWSFTIVKSVGRVLGNLGAVLIVPFLLLLATGHNWLLIALVFVLSIVMYRYFLGNYILACIGLAGTVLVLDQTMSPSDAIYIARVFATAGGALIGIAVAMAIPTWASTNLPAFIDSARTHIHQWAQTIEAADDGQVERSSLQKIGAQVRTDLIKVRSVSESAFLEPRFDSQRRAEVIAAEQFTDAAQQADQALLVLGYRQQRLIMAQHGEPGSTDTTVAPDEALALQYQRMVLSRALYDIDRF